MWRAALLVLAAAIAAAVIFTRPPIPQWPEYHVMADVRPWLGVPNALNVLSNVPFAIVGVLGLVRVFSRATRFRAVWERWPYAAFFAGTALTAIGSSYYHLAPDNARLVWDRLPMTVAFMGLLAAMLTERVGIRAGRLLFAPLLAAGIASVWYWSWTEAAGAGDLRFYALVQFGSLALVLLLLVLYPPAYSGSGYLFAGLTLYGLSKVFEAADYQIFSLGRIVSGHTLKHLAAAAGAACVVGMLRRRTHAPSDLAQDARRPPRRAVVRAAS